MGDVERMEIKSTTESDSIKLSGNGDIRSNSTNNIYQSLLAHEDFESYQQKKSANKFQYIIGVSLFTLVLGVVAYCIYVFAFSDNRPHGSKDDDSHLFSECYIEPSCKATKNYDPTTGFTNDTGWSTDIYSGECCQICLPGTKTVNCFGPPYSPECLNKTGNGDYDYLLFDQIWIPQLCNAWAMGHDPTLSHLAGSSCGGNYLTEGNLSIHGLWPNYYTGFPACCGLVTGDIEPLRPEEVMEWSIFPQLKQQWVEPLAQVNGVDVGSSCADTCYLLNHEWEKHGTCYSNYDPEKYFSAALAINSILASTSSIINDMKGKVVYTSEIKGLFSNTTNVICDSQDSYNASQPGVGVFMELQTCWIEVGDKAFSQVACKGASSGTFTYPCPEKVFVKG
jgi:ribonuclease T2